MLTPDQYFPCLANTEKGAVRLVYSDFMPLLFVVPVQPITDYYTSSADNFTGRQELFENMFAVIREEVYIPILDREVECYIGFYAFMRGWTFYPPIADGTTPPACRIYDYSEV